MDDLSGAVGKGVQPPDGTTERDWKLAVMLAYGHLWHINNEPAAPIALYDPERAAYQARRHLRDLLTTQERGEAINQVGFLIGRYEATREAAEPSMSTTSPPENSGTDSTGEPK